MITTQEIVKLLIDMKFDDDMILGNPARQRRNDILNKAIMIVESHITKDDIYKPENEDLMADPDCVGGACPVR